MSAIPFLAAGDKPLIDWASLGKVAGVSLIFGIGLVVLFAIGIVGLSIARGHDVEEGSAGARATPLSGNRAAGATLAGLCFVVCAAAVLYGLWLIIPQFH